MDKDPKKIIIQILTIIGYQDNIERFADEFINLCIQTASFKTLNNLPENIKTVIKNRLKGIKEVQKAAYILKDYVSSENFQRNLTNATSLLMQNYLENIIPSLDPEQKNSLNEYLKSI